jgi:hypothetical protein
MGLDREEIRKERFPEPAQLDAGQSGREINHAV